MTDIRRPGTRILRGVPGAVRRSAAARDGDGSVRDGDGSAYEGDGSAHDGDGQAARLGGPPGPRPVHPAAAPPTVRTVAG
ncbi:hypothetical protein GCM10009864_37340 [Streptomyces lunalinharesii]|uniref:Uncharacterized protein n=1 Tax=Streptomyces lunalinharesii TaxID=333384 RepID=A0ABP6ECB4_9ACTN